MLYMEDIEEISDDNSQLTKPKVKKPRSQKQIEAFTRAMEKRQENIKLKKEEKLVKASEILVKANQNKKITQQPPPKDNYKSKKIIMQKEEEEESDTEEEIIIVKSKPKPKKKKKTIIVEDSDDESSIDSDGSKEFDKISYSKSKPKYRQQQPIVNRNIEIQEKKPSFNHVNFFI